MTQQLSPDNRNSSIVYIREHTEIHWSTCRFFTLWLIQGPSWHQEKHFPLSALHPQCFLLPAIFYSWERNSWAHVVRWKNLECVRPLVVSFQVWFIAIFLSYLWDVHQTKDAAGQRVDVEAESSIIWVASPNDLRRTKSNRCNTHLQHVHTLV